MTRSPPLAGSWLATWLIAVSGLTGCGCGDSDVRERDAGAGADSTVVVDARVVDAFVLDAAGADLATEDATTDDGGDCLRPTDDGNGWFSHAGGCYQQTPTCCDDSDCDPAVYFGCIDADGAGPTTFSIGRCRAWEICNCVSDADCETGAICIANQRVCGACVLGAPACNVDGDCPSGQSCIGSTCAGECGEPPCAVDADCETGQLCLREAQTDRMRCADAAFAQPDHCETDADCRSCVPTPPVCCDQLPEALVARNRFNPCTPSCCTCEGPCPADAPWAPSAECTAGRCELVLP